MKKLNKLLMPVVGLSTIAATAIPLASCSKSTEEQFKIGVKVTADEWKDALIYLSGNKEGATWKSSSEDVIEAFNFKDGSLVEFEEYFNIAFNDNVGTMSVVGIDDDETAIAKLNSIYKNNAYFEYIVDAEGTEMDPQIEQVGIIWEALTEIMTKVNAQDGYTFDETTGSYYFAGETTIGKEPAYASSRVRFNSDKQITYINMHAIVMDSNEQIDRISNVELHPIYNNVTVDVDSKYIERASAHAQTLTSNEAIFELDNTKQRDIASLIIKNKAISTSNTITFATAKENTNRYVDSLVIYKNDERFEDYTFDNDVITFTSEIKSTDTINILITFSSYACKSQKVSVTLA